MPIKTRLDDVDMRIIEVVSANPALTQSEQAKKVGLSNGPYSMRLEWLRKQGILDEPTISLDATKFGYLLAVYQIITVKKGFEDSVRDFFLTLANIRKVVRTKRSQKATFVIDALFKNEQDLKIANDLLTDLDGIESVSTIEVESLPLIKRNILLRAEDNLSDETRTDILEQRRLERLGSTPGSS